MENDSKFTPPLGNTARIEAELAQAAAAPRYIVETPNQLWGGYVPEEGKQ